jgi:Uri superfamily endonuclease
MSTFPKDKGTYILLLQMQEPSTIVIGKKGTFDFNAGWYAYVGSAFGSGGLAGRLKHHLAPVKKPHWHLDYLRAHAIVREVWYVASEIVYEHIWAEILTNLPNASIPVPRFGASDCKCATHLVCLSEKPIIAHHINTPELATHSLDTRNTE